MLLVALLFAAAQATYEVDGQVPAAAPASVSLFGATTPFATSTLADSAGHFRFRRVTPGAYTLAVFVPGKGEWRTTVDVGPGSADARCRVHVSVDSPAFAFDAETQRNTVSARALTIPGAARREYEQAQKDLGRRDVGSAVAHLQRAVQLAPQFAVAWNNLGAISYQAQRFEQAEAQFRRALKEDPHCYEALVNLGGVLATERKPSEALAYNQHAVLVRPNDALAKSPARPDILSAESARLRGGIPGACAAARPHAFFEPAVNARGNPPSQT
ncbi:MAG TPA: tetratricopeptide repeat protein [Bryobacteraceae bacterium]|nr:tetratricopeptide repeat protein [Bryobacteraceae bacterium]